MKNVSKKTACAGCALTASLEQSLPLFNTGKVRDTYELPGHPDKLLVVATDRISVFDFILPALVPFKGEVLTAMTVFWLTTVFRDVKSHLFAYGGNVDSYLPRELSANSELHRRGLVVTREEMLLNEFIARGYLTGSGWADYQTDGKVCGIELPSGLNDGSKLPELIFTPSTKAAKGHDVNVSAEDVVAEHGAWVRNMTLSFLRRAQGYALLKGIIIADTKFEFGKDGVLADEVLTPDSSRFWGVEEWETAQRYKKAPAGLDKEPVRVAAREAEIDGQIVDIKTLKPEIPEDVKVVSRWIVPVHVIDETTARYLAIFETLTGHSLRKFQTDWMGA